MSKKVKKLNLSQNFKTYSFEKLFIVDLKRIEQM
jgi:hypothetical protein